jgi:phenylacetate-CoA ligase
MTAGAECYAYVGGACGQMPGAHINEDWGIVQAVDPATGAEVADGEWGDLVVTTLDRDNGLLRYDLEEACAILREPCSCGETSIRGLWGGRFKDLIAVQGTRFQANEVESALRAVGEINEPTLEWQTVRPAEDARRLVVRVERGTGAGGDDTEIAARCAAVIREALNIDADVTVLAREAIPRSGYKAGRVVDE